MPTTWLRARLTAVLLVLLLGSAACNASGEPAGEVSGTPGPPATVPTDGRGPVTVVAAGDISDCSDDDCPAADTAPLAASYHPDAVLTLGDLQYPSGELDDFLAEYDKTWGALREVTQPVPGNHEYQTDGAAGYYSYFGAAAHPKTGGYYSYDVGAWHAVALNSNDQCEELGCDDGSVQQRWFAADLAASDARCSLAYWHHPRWSTGEHLDTEAVDDLWRTAAAGGVDLVLNGHDHNFERYAPQDGLGDPDSAGVTEMVVGTGGTDLRAFPVPASPLTAFRVTERNGVLRLLLNRGSYRWQFVAVGGEILDSGRARCG